MRVVVLLLLLTTGCGGTDTSVDVLKGKDVGVLAERQLETQNPTMSPGTLACPDLDFEVGASVRCLRTTELSEGRVVKVEGTVEVTAKESGGKLHIKMDDHAKEFGLAGTYVANGVRQQYARRFHREPGRLDCPYLRGEVGNEITCHLEFAGDSRDVDVVVTAVHPAQYDTDYTFKAAGVSTS
jgi:hypothetical protein